jgi:hypothetical protein
MNFAILLVFIIEEHELMIIYDVPIIGSLRIMDIHYQSRTSI